MRKLDAPMFSSLQTDFSFDIPEAFRHPSVAFMKKYLALAILPILASCSSTQRPLKLSEIPERPSQEGAEYATTNLNKGLSYPVKVIDQSATSSIDVVEDTAGIGSNVGTRLVRDGANISFRSARRGGNVVRKEFNRYGETVYDVNDQATGLIHDEMIDTTNVGLNAYERTMHSGGTVVCGTMTTYSNIWDSATRGLFGGLLRCVVRDTKPYMVGSLNDTIRDDTMPGSSWRKKLPDLSGYAVTAAPSGKGVYTNTK